MQGISITAKNTTGRKALQKHLDDKKKNKRRERFLYSQSFREEITRDAEGILSVDIIGKHRYILSVSMRPIALDMMEQNGALLEKDYTIQDIEVER